MSAKANRNGPPVTPATTTAGTPATDDRVVTFEVYTRPCVVCNGEATDPLYVKVNAAPASNTDFHFKILAGESLDVSFQGIVNVNSLSLYYANVASAYAKAVVYGWTPA